jgi:murein DD-endopeptidase MepM/ murein hydrolase activator NlpD
MTCSILSEPVGQGVATGVGRRGRRATLGVVMSALLGACGPGLTPITGPVPVAPPRGDVVAVPVAPPAAMADADYLRARELMVPVAGVAPGRLSDSFTAARGGERTHNALDIMAPRGTPALAADDGRVFRVGENRLGGLTVYLLDAAERFIYYYAHLDGYREGLRDGMPVARGDVLGYVGTTGNAPANTPHLHFQAMRYRRDRYWEGQPVNPKPYLVVTGRAAASTNANTNEQQPHR